MGDKIMNTVDFILQNKIIVIVRGVAREDLIPFAEAVYDAGVRLIECTYDASGNTPDTQIADNIRMLAEHFEGKMLIGAGTVLTKNQVDLTAKAGGTFIISPDTNAQIIAHTKEWGMASIPGAMTPSEITAADRAGADFIKVFPVNFFGPKYIKALSAPLSHVRMLAVGSVTPENMKEYLEAGAVGFGIGGTVVNKELIANGEFEKITENAKKYVDNCK